MVKAKVNSENKIFSNDFYLKKFINCFVWNHQYLRTLQDFGIIIIIFFLLLFFFMFFGGFFCVGGEGMEKYTVGLCT